MSVEDPFFIVKDEVFKALNKTRGLYLHWRDLGDSSGAEVEWTTTELRNSLRSIEWDLEDLEDTIFIVEKNPSKFKIDSNELLSRRHFVNATKDEVKLMKERMSLNRGRDRDITAHQPLLDNLNEAKNITPSLANVNVNNVGNSIGINLVNTMSSSRHCGTKYSKLENSLDSPSHYIVLDSPSHKFIEENASLQQRILSSPDEQLDVISESVGTLKTVSRQIGVELDEQAVMLDDFGNELETTESKLDNAIKKVTKVCQINNDNRQWIAIAILSILLLIVIILFAIL